MAYRRVATESGGEMQDLNQKGENATDAYSDGWKKVANARSIIASAGRALREQNAEDADDGGGGGGGGDATEKFHAYQKILKKALKENPLAPYDRQISRLNVFNSIMAVLSLVCGIVMVEIHWQKVEIIPASSRAAPDIFTPVNSSFISQFSKWINTLSCIMLQVGIYYWYQVQLTKMKLKGICFKSEGLSEANLLKPYLIESFIALIHPIPMLEAKFTYPGSGEFKTVYSTNDIIIVFMMPRLYLVVRTFFDQYGFNGEDLDALGRLNNVGTGFMFGVKSLLRQKPFMTLMAWNCFGILNLAYAISIFERPTDLDFQSYRNCVWVVFVTFATVGYGDVYPTTDFGRVIAVIACLLAQLNLALLILGCSHYFALSHQEEKVLFTINNRSYVRLEKVKAAIVLQRFWRSCAGLNDSEEPLVQYVQYEKDYMMARAIREFREYKRTKPVIGPSMEVLVLDTFMGTSELLQKMDSMQEMMANSL